MEKIPKVFIAIPSKNALVHAKLAQWLLTLPKEPDHMTMFTIGMSPIAAARNETVKKFLETDCTHLLFLDDDTIPPTGALEKLLKMDTPIATGITHIVEENKLSLNIYLEKKNELQRVPTDSPLLKETRVHIAAVGSSCIMIAREVFEKMEMPYYADIWFNEGQYCSEDIMFCNTARELGYTILCDPSIMCQHARYVLI